VNLKKKKHFLRRNFFYVGKNASLSFFLFRSRVEIRVVLGFSIVVTTIKYYYKIQQPLKNTTTKYNNYYKNCYYYKLIKYATTNATEYSYKYYYKYYKILPIIILNATTNATEDYYTYYCYYKYRTTAAATTNTALLLLLNARVAVGNDEELSLIRTWEPRVSLNVYGRGQYMYSRNSL